MTSPILFATFATFARQNPALAPRAWAPGEIAVRAVAAAAAIIDADSAADAARRLISESSEIFVSPEIFADAAAIAAVAAPLFPLGSGRSQARDAGGRVGNVARRVWRAMVAERQTDPETVRLWGLAFAPVVRVVEAAHFALLDATDSSRAAAVRAAAEDASSVCDMHTFDDAISAHFLALMREWCAAPADRWRVERTEVGARRAELAQIIVEQRLQRRAAPAKVVLS